MTHALFVMFWLMGGGNAPRNTRTDKLPMVSYWNARKHAIKPRKELFSVPEIVNGSRLIVVSLVVSATGAVVSAEMNDGEKRPESWPSIRDEIKQWRFTPFEKAGQNISVQTQAFIELIPPEKHPSIHVTAPVIHPDSKVNIQLTWTQCFGECPAYTVGISPSGIVFVGEAFTVAEGKHVAPVDLAKFRKLAQHFVDADFYSMESCYADQITDIPSAFLSITIDGRTKSVRDYFGRLAGMPEVIVELEEETNKVANEQRWVEGDTGLVTALRAEGFDFKSNEAQAMLKRSAHRGKTLTVKEFLQAGVPLEPLDSPILERFGIISSPNPPNWLDASSDYPDTLAALIDAGASKYDQADKDRALANATYRGHIDAMRALISYGASMKGSSLGEVLMSAARSGKPGVVREVLKYHPDLKARNQTGQPVVFATDDSGMDDEEVNRAECVRLLAEAGADVNARDAEGNTLLHQTMQEEIIEELLKLGADVNARNNSGETPVFHAPSESMVSFWIQHGADMSVKNNKGQTITEALAAKGVSGIAAPHGESKKVK
jgi:ankyrin repeat protein